MKLALVGSRGFLDLTLVEKYVAALPKDLELVSGGADGVDTKVEQAAAKRGMKVQVIVPNYDKHGHGAPFVRNQRIVDESEAVVVFWDGKSRGTSDVMMRAMRAKKLQWIFMGGTPPLFTTDPSERRE